MREVMQCHKISKWDAGVRANPRFEQEDGIFPDWAFQKRNRGELEEELEGFRVESNQRLNKTYGVG